MKKPRDGHINLALPPLSNRSYPGAGHTSFASILAALREMKYADWVSAEILPKPDVQRAAEETYKTPSRCWANEPGAPKVPKVPNSVQFATLAIVGGLYAGGAVGVLHFLNREYDVIAQPLSYYAVGAYGWLMTSAMGAFAVSALALAAALKRGAAHISPVGIAFLCGAGACFVIAGIFPTDVTVDNLPCTASGAIHVAASYLASPCLVAAALLLSRQFGDARRRHVGMFALALASWAALVILVIVNHFNLGVGGIIQRIFVAVIWVWVVLAALRLGWTSAEHSIGIDHD